MGHWSLHRVVLLCLLCVVQAQSQWLGGFQSSSLKTATTSNKILAPKLCPCRGQQSTGCPDGFPQAGCLRLTLQCVCRRPFCNTTVPCALGTSCDLGWNKCFSSPRGIGDPCKGDSDCGQGLKCSVDTSLCTASVNNSSSLPRIAPAPSPAKVGSTTTLLTAAVTSPAELTSSATLSLGSACSLTSQCIPGLVCDKCPGGNDITTCRQGSWTMQSSDYGRPYNKVPWLVAHNAYAQNVRPPNSWAYSVFLNQDLSVTEQLNLGARGLMLDVYLVNGDVYLCHSYCDFGKIPLGSILSEIKSWMDSHPSEVVTLFFEDYVSGQNPGKLTSAFSSAGLLPYLFPSGQMPTDGSDWPSVRTMASNGQRLVVWTDARGGDFPWQWDYYVEAMYGSLGMNSATCPTRDNGSSDLSDRSRQMVLVNWFGDLEASSDACADNRLVTLQAKLQACYAAAGGRWANFLAVDFFEHNDDGGPFKTLEWLSQQWRSTAP